MESNNILIIDDDKITTVLLSNLLNETYNTFVLNSLENIDLISYLKQNDISLVLLDIEMPIKNGFEVAREIKSNEELNKTPIIFLTANTDESFVLSAFENKGDDYVRKPFNNEELKARIKTHITNYNYLKKIKEQQEIIHAQAMNMGMSDMLVKISHHWRQPLSIVSLSAQAINFESEMGQLDKQTVKKLTDDIITSVASLSENINFFSSMYSYKASIKDVYPYKEFDDIVDVLNELFVGKDLEINLVKKLSSKTKIAIDIKGLKNVIINLVSNSCDAYEINNVLKYKIDIIISIKDNYFLVDVLDFAGGVEEKNLSKIFEAYFSTKANLNGTGLGLFICKNTLFYLC